MSFLERREEFVKEMGWEILRRPEGLWQARREVSGKEEYDFSLSKIGLVKKIANRHRYKDG